MMERGTAFAVILAYMVLALLAYRYESIDDILRDVVRAELTP